MSRLISTFCLFVIGVAALLAASYGQPDEVRTIGGTLVFQAGVAGRFLAWLAIAMLSSIVFSSDALPIVQRWALAFVLFLFGTSIVAFGSSPAVLLQLLRTHPAAVLSSYRIGIFSVVALIAVPFLLAAGPQVRQRPFPQFSLVQISGATLLTCLLLPIVRTHGAFAFHYFATLAMLGLIGARLAGLQRSDSAWSIVSIAPIGVQTMAIAVVFALNHYDLTNWMGRSPKLAMFTLGGVLPLVASVAFAVLFTWFTPRNPTRAVPPSV